MLGHGGGLLQLQPVVGVLDQAGPEDDPEGEGVDVLDGLARRIHQDDGAQGYDEQVGSLVHFGKLVGKLIT